MNNSNQPKKRIDEEKHEINMQYHLYFVFFLAIYLGSYFIPGIIFMLYFFLLFIPFFLENNNFISIFINIRSLLVFLLMPLVILGCYVLHLLFIGLITRLIWRWTERKCPTKNGIILRNVPSDVLNYYHLRSFIIKYGKNAFTKGLFPWLLKWFYNFVGSCKIGKGTTIEEEIAADKFVNIGKNCYIGVNSAIVSHMVEGIFGRIPYFEIKIGDNVTCSAFNLIAPGCVLKDNSYLLPLGSIAKNQTTKGNNYYFGIPMRKIFKKKIMEYLKISEEDLEKNKAIKKKQEIRPKAIKEKRDNNEMTKIIPEVNDNKLSSSENTDKTDLTLDFTTSSSISRVNIKFLAIYLPIFWLSGILVAIYLCEHIRIVSSIESDIGRLTYIILSVPFVIFTTIFIFVIGCVFFSKLFLILINLIHLPKEGVFKAELRNNDFEFWCLRTELKKLVIWLLRNSPVHWFDGLAFRWFGVKIDFSSQLQDSWCDIEFIKLGRKVMIGQGAVVMSSMVVGKYLIIKKVILNDYTVIGGMACISPGTITGRDSLLGAISSTILDQVLDSGWVYFGIPCIKLKPNKFAYVKYMTKSSVDDEQAISVEHDINIEEDKKKKYKL